MALKYSSCLANNKLLVCTLTRHKNHYSKNHTFFHHQRLLFGALTVCNSNTESPSNDLVISIPRVNPSKAPASQVPAHILPDRLKQLSQNDSQNLRDDWHLSLFIKGKIKQLIPSASVPSTHSLVV